MNLKKSDLVFISKLDIDVTLTAKLIENCPSSKKAWYLEIRTKKEGAIGNGILIGARGEIREFKQLNAVYILVEEIFGKGSKFEVII